MIISLEEFIVDIANKINDEQVSFFIGSGVSTELDLPNWKDLFSEVAGRLSLNIDDVHDYYQLAQYYCNKFSESDLKRLIAPKLQTQDYDSPTLNMLLKLKFKSIWTTNYDMSIENCLNNRRIIYTKVHEDKDLSNINANQNPILFKINGDINDLSNIVLTQSDWENFEYTHPTMLTFLKKELVSNTFLFLGYSFHDNLIKSALSSIRKFVGRTGIHHYAIFQKNQGDEFKYFIDDLDMNYNIKAVLVDNYSEIPCILEKIFYKTIERNIFISGRLDDYSEEVESFANTLLSQLSVNLLKNNYNIYTGMGRKIGYFVAGPSIQYLLSKGVKSIDKHIQIRPFDDNLSAGDITSYRKYLIEQNHVLVFVFGQKYVNGVSEDSAGVLEEFEIAQKLNKKIIPIGSTGFAAKKISEIIRNSMTSYPYLESYIDLLNKERDVNIISNAVVCIINSLLNTY